MELPKLVLLSGPICSGKSTLAKRLAEKFNFVSLKTTQFVLARKRCQKMGRLALQKYGQQLDSRYGGGWLVEDIGKAVQGMERNVIIDSVRT